jgi:hypothetical protein
MKQVSTPPLGVQILSVGFGPKLERAIGVHVPCQVRSTLLASGARSTVTCPAGSMGHKTLEKTRDSLQISDREELNDERGESPCQ